MANQHSEYPMQVGYCCVTVSLSTRTALSQCHGQLKQVCHDVTDDLARARLLVLYCKIHTGPLLLVLSSDVCTAHTVLLTMHPGCCPML